MEDALALAAAQTAAAFLGLGLWALALRRTRTKPAGPTLTFNSRQVFQIAAQVLIIGYWGLYVPQVFARWPYLLLQLAFALGADFLANWQCRGKLSASSAVLPIVLSVNFFVWFDGPDFWIGLLVILAAVLSKGLFRWKHDPERHVFNPSGIAIALTGACFFVLGSDRYVALDGYLGLPPNMTETVLLAGVLVQLAYGTGLATLAGLWTILLMNLLLPKWGAHSPSPFQVQTFLGLTLFMVDPKTMPKGQLGRLLFGVAYGAIFAGWYMASGAIMGSESYFTKAFAIPFANLAVPGVERLARALARKLPQWSPRPFLVAAAAAAAMVLSVALTYTGQEKCWLLEDALKGEFKTGQGTPLLKVPADGGIVTCADNPVFARPFSYFDELAAWRAVTR